MIERQLAAMFLKRLTEVSVVSIPSNWSSAKQYEAWVATGDVERVPSDNPFMVSFRLTPKGRETYNNLDVKPLGVFEH